MKSATAVRHPPSFTGHPLTGFGTAMFFHPHWCPLLIGGSLVGEHTSICNLTTCNDDDYPLVQRAMLDVHRFRNLILWHAPHNLKPLYARICARA